MKEFNRNWKHITSQKINVGDLVWWNFNSYYYHNQERGWKLCIITDVKLDKADQKTRSDWWKVAHPTGRHQHNEHLLTDYVENWRRDKCKFNSIRTYTWWTGWF